eukprot:COSAG02_NODE_6346_length_3634_cov_4.485714_3_plen_68_part_00
MAEQFQVRAPRRPATAATQSTAGRAPPRCGGYPRLLAAAGRARGRVAAVARPANRVLVQKLDACGFN